MSGQANGGLVVGFERCERELLARAPDAARTAYGRWTRRPGYGRVVAFVHAFEHRHLFRVTAEDLERVKRESEHALGDVRSEEQMPDVENFTCPFALQHLFHFWIETHGRLPLWQEWWAWMWRDACRGFVQPVALSVGWAEAGAARREAIRRAVRWRLGKFYYSAFREVEALTRLRVEHGLPLRYHLLADVLLRVDYWLGDAAVCVYFPNPRYRDGRRGRKPPASRFVGGEGSPFGVLHLGIERQGFGRFWTADAESLRSAAEQIRALAGRV